ncbi:MAG: hypothetical protein AAFO89_05165 [Planctomycetota bacterium]
MRDPRALLPIALLSALVLSGCTPSRSTVIMTRTIDVYEAADQVSARPIESFRVGLDLGAPALTELNWVARSASLPGAGGEVPPCNDGERHRLLRDDDLSDDPNLVDVAFVIGDTGGDDISNDRDCGCDTHVAELLLNQIRPVPADAAPLLANLSLGRDELCPNARDDLVVGDREFGGPVDVEFAARMYVQGGRLLLDVGYSVTEAR